MNNDNQMFNTNDFNNSDFSIGNFEFNDSNNSSNDSSDSFSPFDGFLNFLNGLNGSMSSAGAMEEERDENAGRQGVESAVNGVAQGLNKLSSLGSNNNSHAQPAFNPSQGTNQQQLKPKRKKSKRLEIQKPKPHYDRTIRPQF